ncbi:MAG: SxtJ family membrane protein [Pseudomonadota bacterium]|nr:SxtJ family membrane protein [Pseudomonadota bacterium]
MKSQSSNKSFGLLFFVVFLIIGLWPLKNGENLNFYFITTSIIFLILGLINSKLLTPLNKSWIKLGEILGIIIAPIVMALVYFVILTPVSLIVRIFGKDLLSLKLLKEKETYWIERKKSLGSMKKQF